MNIPIMKENELSPFGKALAAIGGLALGVVALVNISIGEVSHPFAFSIVAIGFLLFLMAKLSVVMRRRWISFGPSLMTPGMADAYRVGYWLMVAGIVASFI